MRKTWPQFVARVTETLLPPDMVFRLRTKREWLHWVSTLTPEALKDLSNAPEEVQRQLFKANVTLVEIETHAKCNRICDFCPNVTMDRRMNEVRTDAAMLDRVFRELGAIDYRRQIKVARYSEPLTNVPYLCERLASARRLVPHAQLAVVTNTDYLRAATLEQLRGAGLNVLFMSLYLRSSEKWSPELANQYNDRLAKKLDLRITQRVGTRTSVRCFFDYPGILLLSSCHNWDEYGTDRGGSVEQYSSQNRCGPCREPFETFVIDYTGAVLPCCALRSDLPDQKDFAVGDLSQPGSSIFGVYAGQLAAWRRSMVGFGAKASPCTTCTHRDIPRALAAPVAARLKKHLHRIGLEELYEPPPADRGLVTIRPLP